MRRLPFLIASAVLATGAVVPATVLADEELNGPRITAVDPDPIDGCGTGEITVTGSGFTDGSGEPVFVFGVIASGPDDVQVLQRTALTADTAVFRVGWVERPLRTDGVRTFSLVSFDEGTGEPIVLATSEPLEIDECELARPATPSAPVVVPGETSLAFSWEAITDFGDGDADGYAVQWFPIGADGGFRTITTDHNTTETTIPDLTPGIAYGVRVFALSTILPSEPSAVTQATPGTAAPAPGSPTTPPTTPPPAGPLLGFEPLTPARLLDTRELGQTVDGRFAGGPRPTADSVTRVEVTGRGGVAADSTTVVLSVAAVDPAAAGFLTVYPCTATPPNASNVNFAGGGGSATANAVVAVLADGDVCIYTSAATDLIVDVNGSFALGSMLDAIAPVRLLDTRIANATVDGASSGGGPLGGDTTTVVPIAGRGGVAEDASTALVNVTVVDPVAAGFVTVFPCADGRPDASNVNFVAGQTVANLVAAALDGAGELCVYTSVDAHVLIDASGSAGAAADLVPLVPARLYDSRIPGATVDGLQRGAGRVAADSVVRVDVAGRGGVPDDAIAAVVNITVVDADAPGFLTVWDCSTPRPNASNLNHLDGQGRALAAAAFTELNAAGQLCVYASAGTDLLVDVTVALR